MLRLEPGGFALCRGSLLLGCELAVLLVSSNQISSAQISAQTSAVHAGFTVNLSFSGAAANKLDLTHEGVVVAASYAGQPRPAARRHADEMGQIDLGQERVTVERGVATVRVSGLGLRRKRLPWIKGPVLLNVNVFSARRSSPDNLLSCDFFDGELRRAQGKPIDLHCGLITEQPKTVQVQ